MKQKLYTRTKCNTIPAYKWEVKSSEKKLLEIYPPFHWNKDQKVDNWDCADLAVDYRNIFELELNSLFTRFNKIFAISTLVSQQMKEELRKGLEKDYPFS